MEKKNIIFVKEGINNTYISNKPSKSLVLYILTYMTMQLLTWALIITLLYNLYKELMISAMGQYYNPMVDVMLLLITWVVMWYNTIVKPIYNVYVSSYFLRKENKLDWMK